MIKATLCRWVAPLNSEGGKAIEVRQTLRWFLDFLLRGYPLLVCKLPQTNCKKFEVGNAKAYRKVGLKLTRGPFMKCKFSSNSFGSGSQSLLKHETGNSDHKAKFVLP